MGVLLIVRYISYAIFMDSYTVISTNHHSLNISLISHMTVGRENS